MISAHSWPKPFKEFDIPIYGGRVYVFKTRLAIEKARAHLNAPRCDLDIHRLAGFAEAFYHKEGFRRLYLVGWFTGSVVTLGHELNHVAFMELERVGIDARNDIGETFCFLQGWLMRACGVT